MEDAEQYQESSDLQIKLCTTVLNKKNFDFIHKMFRENLLRRFCKKALLYAVCQCRCRRCRLLHVKFQEWEEPNFKEPLRNL